MYEIMAKLYDPLTNLLEKNLNWYVIPLVFLFFYLIFLKLTGKILIHEGKKRKKVLEEIDVIKGTYRKIIESQEQEQKEKKEEVKIEDENKKSADEILDSIGGNQSNEKMKFMKEIVKKSRFFEMFRFQEKLNEEQLRGLRDKSKEITKKYKANPYITILVFLSQIYMFGTMIVYFAHIDTLEKYWFHPLLLVGLLATAYLRRHTAWLVIPICIMCYCGYRYINGTGAYFIMYYFIYSNINVFWNQYKKRKKQRVQ